MPGRKFLPEYMDILCRLPRSGHSTNLAQLASEMASRLHPFKAQLDKISPDVLDRSLGCLDLDISIPTMLAHGDFAPWNMRKNPEAGYVLVDWEWADFTGLPAYDLLHFQFSDDRLFGKNGECYAAIQRRSLCTEYFRRMDLDAELLPRLAIAYLLHQMESDCKYRGCEQTGYILRQLGAVVDTLGFSSRSGVHSREP
jgi:aminoglycoside phosphotransferase (APT) family kinase protein